MELFNDKPQELNCKVKIQGASLDETKSRVLLKFSDKTLLYEGSIDKDGNCRVEIPALEDVKGDQGEAILEVIAESTIFEPWSDTFTIKRSKSVTVEGASVKTKSEGSEDKQVVVEVSDPKPKNESKKKNKDQAKIIRELVQSEKREKELKEFIVEAIKEYKEFSDSKKKTLSKKLNKNVITSSAKKTISEVAGNCDSDPLKYTAYLINKKRPELLK